MPDGISQGDQEGRVNRDPFDKIGIGGLVRKVQFIREVIYREVEHEVPKPIVRAAAIAVLKNYWLEERSDFTEIAELGRALSEAVMPELVSVLGEPAVSYGKGAIVGSSGEVEHAAALLHRACGGPMRAAIGGGKAVIPSNVKLGAIGSEIDVPLGHKDDPWSFREFDTMTLMIADAPRHDEIMAIITIASGGRPNSVVRKSG
jgi:hypothetical protein